MQPTMQEVCFYFGGHYLISHRTVFVDMEDGTRKELDLGFVPYKADKEAQMWEPFHPSESDQLGFSTYENALRFITNVDEGKPEFEGIVTVQGHRY